MKENISACPVGRFAPTPSGRMHLGNVLTCMIGYLHAKKNGGKYLLRIEDLDALRCPKSAAEQIFSDLDYFGFGFDGEVIFQSERTEVYETYLKKLEAEGLIYPCFCSRAELHAATAPHGDTPVYGGKCRGLAPENYPPRKGALRVKVPYISVYLEDLFSGGYSQNLETECGDFIVRRSDGVFAYQLAMTVDDGESGITEIIRGKDLLSSAPRQTFLFEKFGFKAPAFGHLPLLKDEFGERMSKRTGKSNMEYIREKFPDPRPIIGMLAYNSGILEEYAPVSLSELIPVFDAGKIKRADIKLDPLGLF